MATAIIVGIYRISLDDGRCYIGSTTNMRRRWQRHLDILRNNTHHSPYMQNAWNKYGEDAFTFEVVEECDAEMLIEREQAWIDKEKPVFNTAPAAGSNLGFKHSEETKARMSATHKTLTKSPEHAAKIAEVLRIRNQEPPSQETRQKMSLAKLGKPLPQETRDKISATTKGRVFSDEHRAKISEGLRRSWARRRQEDS